MADDTDAEFTPQTESDAPLDASGGAASDPRRTRRSARGSRARRGAEPVAEPDGGAVDADGEPRPRRAPSPTAEAVEPDRRRADAAEPEPRRADGRAEPSRAASPTPSRSP